MSIKRCVLNITVVLLAWTAVASGQVVEVWVDRYDGPANGLDQARAMAVDQHGNVYVTGESNAGFGSSFVDFTTIKYDQSGERIWVARYNGPANAVDVAFALTVDDRGFVYVTGQSDGVGTLRDYATAKYDPDGNEVWSRRYSGPNRQNETPLAIAVDRGGNVYVTGTEVLRFFPPATQYTTVKYDRDGNELWVRHYTAGAANPLASGRALALDGKGNVYVTGTLQSDPVTGWDYATVKYDAVGNELWVQRFNTPGNRTEEAAAIAVDRRGNVVVTGYSMAFINPLTVESSYYATVKYDLNGTEVWTRLHGEGLGSPDNRASAVAVDRLNNVVVTGAGAPVVTSDRRFTDYLTVKYDGDGNELWTARYDGPVGDFDHARAVALDRSGNVAITGASLGDPVTRFAFATVAYDAHGNEMWAARYDGPGNEQDTPAAVSISDDGCVYVTGTSDGGPATSWDWATIKYAVDSRNRLTLDIDRVERDRR